MGFLLLLLIILGFLQVANFEYVDEAEVEAVLEEEARLKTIPDKGGNANRMDYWHELLKDKYKELKVDEFMSFGKGKRSRKPVRFTLFRKQLIN